MSEKKDKLKIIGKGIDDNIGLIEMTGISGSPLAYVLSRILNGISHPCLIILPSPEEARVFCRDLNFFIPKMNNKAYPDHKRVFFFPSYDISPLAGLSPPKELISQRIEALYTLSTSNDAIVVTSLDGLMNRLLPKRIFLDSVDYIAVNEEIDRDDLIKRLLTLGYFRTSLVEERGDFSVRGGVIDLYPPLYDSAVRIELWGNTVESVRFFSTADQRSSADIEELTILTPTEGVLTPENTKRARSMGRVPAGLEAGGGFPGQEAWLRHFYSNLETMFGYLPEGSHVVTIRSDSLEGRAKSITEKLHKEAERFQEEALERGRPFPQTDNLFVGISELKESIDRHPRISCFDLNIANGTGKDTVKVDFREPLRVSIDRDIGQAKTSLSPLAANLKDWLEEGNNIILICRTEQQAGRLKEILLNYGLTVEEILPGWSQRKDKKGLYICLGYLSQGFRYPDSALIVITEDEIFGEKRARERKAGRDGAQAIQWTGLSQLKVGDFVVHQDHGIGRYRGLSKMEISSKVRDFVIIEYAGKDRLYIPADRINIIQKYIGLDDDNPQLDRLGGKSWMLAKKKARRSIEKIAKDLVQIYAMRKFLKGFAFSKADNYFREFEATFDYEETPDQIKAIDSVLSDMESDKPMDRLVCGDVGFGKTEVAIRASFKAVMDGKQAAILVPTTVLAEQHYRTFLKRFDSYPARIAAMSRFTSGSEQKKIKEDLRHGRIDIIIGTHRILSEDIVFKELGLLVIDEEQRFGVRHKEKLKKYRHSVDVLAITATPIPRTLHLSLMGVRDLSIIQTPPDERLSIQTYIAKFDESIISHAVERELGRGGQVFFVHNRVQTIEAMADRLRKLLPGTRISVAHGQMRERDLEKAMVKFLAKETDVLVCTTIIDSGLDIPSANTIIINKVDRFGLSEIYQLRGRVGRSNVKAYAYLLISDTAVMTTDAQKRLKVLMDFSQLGSGVNIALNDLRIRGGGNILGFSQSGHIKAIGYELYLDLIEKTIAELKGETRQEEIFPEINVDLPVFIPRRYIEESDVRLDIYRRLSTIKDKSELQDMMREIEDRFGPPPEEVLNLFSVIKIKTGLKNIGSTRLEVKDRSMVFSFSENTPISTEKLVELVNNHPTNFSFLSNEKLKVISKKRGFLSVLKEADGVINDLIGLGERP
jgi:transcription-repair coupling factor (superfamily II helicase)